MPNKFSMIAPTLSGLEELLCRELEQIGATDIVSHTRQVNFRGTLETMYKANMHSRLALNILVPLLSFRVTSEQDLYSNTKDYNWNEILDLQMTFAVDSTLVNSVLNSTQYASYRVKDAIVDRFRSQSGKRPFMDEKNPDVRVNVVIINEECTISLDSSGYPLFIRGYRIHKGTGSINEVLAAGMLALSGWKPTEPFHDPMCGTATLLVEAALIASNKAPGLYRREFGFQNWRNYDPGVWRIIQRKAREQVVEFPSDQISGADIDEQVCIEARENITNSGFGNYILIKTRDFLDSKPMNKPGMVIMDTPFGRHVENGDADAFYRKIGSTLKLHYPNNKAFILAPDRKAIRQVGLKPFFMETLYNGTLECRYYGYDLYHKNLLENQPDDQPDE